MQAAPGPNSRLASAVGAWPSREFVSGRLEKTRRHHSQLIARHLARSLHPRLEHWEPAEPSRLRLRVAHENCD